MSKTKDKVIDQTNRANELANKGIDAIVQEFEENMYHRSCGYDAVADEVTCKQALRAFVSRMLMHTNGKSYMTIITPFVPRESMGVSENQNVHIIGATQMECEGIISVVLDGGEMIDYNDIELADQITLARALDSEQIAWRSIPTKCPICKKDSSVWVNLSDYYEWRERRKLIQEAMPYLVPADREMLQTGICGDCFSKLFGQERGDCYGG